MNRKLSAALGVATVLGALAVPGIAMADPISQAAAPAGTSITVSPVRTEVPPSPGRTITEPVTIRAGATAIEVSATALPFSQDSQGRTVSANVPRAVSGVTWVHLPKPFELAAGQTTTVNVTITEPSRPQPGQRYVGVLWNGAAIKSATNAKGAQVGVSGAVASEFILDLPGVQTHTMAYGLTVPSLSWGASVPITTTAKDTGNSYVALNGPAQDIHAGSKTIPDNLFLLGGASQKQTGYVSLGWGIQHVTYHGISKTVVVLPGKQMAWGAALLALAGGIFLLGRRGRGPKQPKPSKTPRQPANV